MSKQVKIQDLFSKYFIYKDDQCISPIKNTNRAHVQQHPEYGMGFGVVLEWWKERDDCMIQVIFSIQESSENNAYLCTIFDRKYQRQIRTVIPSITVYPPVWNREFSLGPDYYDYIKTQNILAGICADNAIEPFPIDETPEGKSLNFTKETPQEIEVLLKEGKSYHILNINKVG